MRSANQLYKESGMKQPFKEWLKIQQENGALKDHETMFNAVGVKPTKRVKAINRNNIIGLVALGFLAVGLYQVSNAE